MVSDPIKILIVDDDEQVLIELERLLESEGYSTTTAWGAPTHWPFLLSRNLTSC
jgi:CheY-like chemotaxis protein